ncbi:ABC transporter permease, partial [Streptomyces sp. NPDC003388]
MPPATPSSPASPSSPVGRRAVLGAAAVVFFAFAADGFLRAASLSTVLYASSTIGIMAV